MHAFACVQSCMCMHTHTHSQYMHAHILYVLGSLISIFFLLVAEFTRAKSIATRSRPVSPGYSLPGGEITPTQSREPLRSAAHYQSVQWQAASATLCYIAAPLSLHSLHTISSPSQAHYYDIVYFYSYTWNNLLLNFVINFTNWTPCRWPSTGPYEVKGRAYLRARTLL